MTVRLSIDGAKHSGHYKATCIACSDSWMGQAEGIGTGHWSPALPIAECVVHVRMEHRNDQVDIEFSDRFKEWLVSYWQNASLRVAARADEARRDAAIRTARAARWR